MSDLNPRQREAVRHIHSPLLVLAGAGSGKTRVITQKIVYLIETIGIPAQQITAVTFTNKAAREMKERVAKLLKQDTTPNISTFHTLGLNILRREHKKLGLKSGFSIFDAQDTEALLKELLKSGSGADGLAKSIQWRISGWKNEMVSPDQALAEAENDLDTRTAILYANYQRALTAYNAVDFDDLILRPARLFEEDSDTLAHWQKRTRHLLVDEYQDTNLCQYQLVKQIVGEHHALTVVGDDDQSIYAWRGARPENLARLKEHFPLLKVIKLEQNYRSSGRILKSANHLIANNPHLFDKKLWSELGPGEEIRIMPCKNENHEAEKVVSEIIHHKFTKGNAHGDYAILYRGNHQAKLFEAALRQNNIPYFLSGGTSFFSRSEVKDVMSYLRLLANPNDDAAFLRIANTPRREIGPTTLEKLGSYANQRHISLLAACRELGLSQTLTGRSLKQVQEFANWVDHYHRLAESAHPVETVRQMLRSLDYEGWLYDTTSSDSIAERRWQNIEELVDWLNKLHQGKQVGDSLAEMINHLALQDMLERQEEEDPGNQVNLMTLHASKGLEFPHVFLVGMEEELLPHKNSIEEENIEEERRLAYVGITRAQRTLTISYAQKRKRNGEINRCEPSRFLDELPESELNWEGRGSERSKEEKQQRGSAHLASMKALLEN